MICQKHGRRCLFNNLLYPKLPSQESDQGLLCLSLHAENDDTRQITSPPEDERPHKSGSLLLHRRAWSEGEEIDDLENIDQILTERDALANAFVWGTTTQRYGLYSQVPQCRILTV